MADRHGHAGQAVGGDGLDLGPQRREVETVVDGQHGHAIALGLFRQMGQAFFEREQRVGPPGIDLHDGWRGVSQRRQRGGIHQACLHGLHAGDQAVHAVGLAVVALSGGDRLRNNGRMRR
ncbi:hypothetical protein D3C72_1864230 [compost metagenome]